MTKTPVKKPAPKVTQPPAQKPVPEQLIGYARVSSTGQDLAAQLEQLTAAGCVKIFKEKLSGAGMSERRELIKLIKAIEPGDVLTVTSIDRLARSVLDLFFIVRQVSEAGGGFRSLVQPWANTSTASGRLMLAILGGLADVERDLIKARTTEGRDRAKAEGRHIGRPSVLTPRQQDEALRRRLEGATLKELAESYDVAISTIARLTKQ
jgi:DNA invertase Pin-like site-specific DNA recombinase